MKQSTYYRYAVRQYSQMQLFSQRSLFLYVYWSHISHTKCKKWRNSSLHRTIHITTVYGSSYGYLTSKVRLDWSCNKTESDFRTVKTLCSTLYELDVHSPNSKSRTTNGDAWMIIPYGISVVTNFRLARGNYSMCLHHRWWSSFCSRGWKSNKAVTGWTKCSTLQICH